MALSWPAKDPDETLNYLIRWAPRIPGDNINEATFSVISGHVSIQGSSFDGTANTTTVILSGGTEGEVCEIHCRATTVGGLVLDQTVQLRIKSR